MKTETTPAAPGRPVEDTRPPCVPLDTLIRDIRSQLGFPIDVILTAIFEEVDAQALILLYRDGELIVQPGPRVRDLARFLPPATERD